MPNKIEVIRDMECTLTKVTGWSEKKQKEYTLYQLVVHADEIGDQTITLNTFNDRAGILLSTLDKN